MHSDIEELESLKEFSIKVRSFNFKTTTTLIWKENEITTLPNAH